jgi:hypothetical protein
MDLVMLRAGALRLLIGGDQRLGHVTSPRAQARPEVASSSESRVTSSWQTVRAFFARLLGGIRGRAVVQGLRVPEPRRLGLVQHGGKTGEWRITIDGKQLVAFYGADAHPRAEQHYRELVSLCRAAWKQ